MNASLWGYSINKDRQIDFDKQDKSAAEFVMKNEPTFNLCISCGSCTATCRIPDLVNYNPRKMQVLLRRGMIKYAKRMIILCQLCAKCEQLCPRGVKTRNVYLLIREGLKRYEI